MAGVYDQKTVKTTVDDDETRDESYEEALLLDDKQVCRLFYKEETKISMNYDYDDVGRINTVRGALLGTYTMEGNVAVCTWSEHARRTYKFNGDFTSDKNGTQEWQSMAAELAAAPKIREQEASDFAAEEKELTTVISMLKRATSTLSEEMAKSGASMLQLKGATSIEDALRVMVQASVLSSADALQLTALVQTELKGATSIEDALRVIASQLYKDYKLLNYEGQSDGIIRGFLMGLLEKATRQLNKARKLESYSLQNFQMLKQALPKWDRLTLSNFHKRTKDEEEKALANPNAVSLGLFPEHDSKLQGLLKLA